MKRSIRKKIKIWSCIVVSILSGFLSIAVNGAEASEMSEIPEELKNLYARSAVLMDGDSGRVLFGKNETEVLPMASTTKIMTCILALEKAKPDEICTVSAEAAAQPQVRLGMRTGEAYRLEDLLYSLMLESHNDSAVCVAEQVGGSVEGFANLMNQKAEEIGCRSAHFVTPNGLDASDEGGVHSISAKDLALILRYCIQESGQREKFLEITRTSGYTFQDTSGKRSFYCANHNALLTSLEGALTGKTGFTSKAGYCYVGAVRREEKTLIVALLACGWPNNRTYKWSDTRRLAEYGFANYEKKSLEVADISLPRILVLRGILQEAGLRLADPAAGENTGPGTEKQARAKAGASDRNTRVQVLLQEGEALQVKLQTVPALRAPVQEGQRAGTLQVLLGEDVLWEYELVCREDIGEITYRYCIGQVLEEFLF